ncbi:MAG: hypothetical protein PUE66_06580 [Erysipelotrichaceae bacterium]|nr:hypothetical protein [Erysipelotrichaceae bacterium]MDY5728165.1 hypothetical protein [Erysipelotrichaceae bacterium]
MLGEDSIVRKEIQTELARLQFTYIAMFQAGWFVESMWSQTLVIHMIRTPKLPNAQLVMRRAIDKNVDDSKWEEILKILQED